MGAGQTLARGLISQESGVTQPGLGRGRLQSKGFKACGWSEDHPEHKLLRSQIKTERLGSAQTD